MSASVPVVDAADPAALERAAAVLRDGGAVVLPTDTVYGLAALPSVAGATDALYRLKDRAATQPFAVLVADVDQALALLDRLDDDVRDWLDRLWPGPLTVVGSRRPEVRHLALGGSPDTIGVRCPAHDFVRSLAALVGPVATTSANRSGEPTPTSARAAAEALVEPVDLVVDGGPASTVVASTVVDTVDGARRILRPGAITPDDLGLPEGRFTDERGGTTGGV